LARAKQTNRADARRRYRQTVTQDVEADAVDDLAPASSGSAKASDRPTSPQTGRPGLGSAFRNAYRQPHYREDLRALPELVRGRWFLVAIGLTVLGFVLYVVLPNPITALLWSIASLPIGGPTLPIFLVGFTAPRASYLLGPAVGIANLAIAAIVIALVPQMSTNGSVVDVVSQGALYGLPTAVIFASGAAWYRRFLGASNPRIGGRNPRGGRSKSAQKAAARR
jgi:hypothetical protein